MKPLTPRECEIVVWISLGHTDMEIAVLLGISAKTVSTHRKNMIRKLKLRNTAHLVRYAMENRLA